jgi:hypothetical protein
VSAADTNRPDTDQPSGHRPWFRKQQRTAKASAVSGSATTWTPAAVSGCPAGCGRMAADPQPPFRREGSAAHVALARLRWSSRPGRCSRLVSAVRMRGHRTRPAGHRTQPAGHREPARLRHGGHPRAGQGHADTAAAATLDSRQQNRPHRSHVRPERDRNVQHRPASPPDRQIRRLVSASTMYS